MINRILEISYQDVIKSLEKRHITQQTAAKKFGVSTRQVRRSPKRFQKDGASGLVSKHRGKKSNNQLSAQFRAEIAKLIREKCLDFGPTLAHEKLTENHAKKLSVESI